MAMHVRLFPYWLYVSAFLNLCYAQSITCKHNNWLASLYPHLPWLRSDAKASTHSAMLVTDHWLVSLSDFEMVGGPTV